MFIRFEDLTQNPSLEIKKIYEYLGLSEFIHDFSHVEQLTKEDDVIYGMAPDLHTIRPVVEYKIPDYKEVLGSQLCKWIDQSCVGYQDIHNYS